MQQDMFTKKLTKAQHEMLGRIYHALTGMGCQWFVITPDGERYGNIPEENVKIKQVKQPSGKRGALKHPYGTKRNYVRPYLDGLKEGEVAEIPFHDFIPPGEVQNAACSYASDIWGKGTYVSVMHNDRKVIEVLRTGGL